MDTTANNFSKQGQALADSAADKMQGGIRTAQRAANNAGDTLSGKVDDLRSEAAPLIRKTANQAQSLGKSGLDAVSDAAQRARDSVSDASDAIISYTKENPVKALAIAAASGALLYGIVKMIQATRD
jgi:ElaB/YqjD/DUF883 family membrane-anchored ribosome-binding protein